LHQQLHKFAPTYQNLFEIGRGRLKCVFVAGFEKHYLITTK
jgi:hypothetical protein